MTENPLVSIVVITYNSAQFVLDTLESIKNQTYQNTELILSDDASLDNTLELCQNWASENNDRFVEIKIISVKENSGIPGNCNRGIAAAKGEWIKLIAGDDLLLSDCISNNYRFVENTSKKIVISNMISFLGDSELEEMKINYLDAPAEDQHQFLIKAYWGNSPSYFISKEIFISFKYDEQIKLMEDYPFALCVTANGHKIHYLNKVTVKYRIGHTSVYGTNENYLFHDFFLKLDYFNEKYRYPYMSSDKIKSEKFENKIKKLFIKFHLRKRNLATRILFRIALILNPYS